MLRRQLQSQREVRHSKQSTLHRPRPHPYDVQFNLHTDVFTARVHIIDTDSAPFPVAIKSRWRCTWLLGL